MAKTIQTRPKRTLSKKTLSRKDMKGVQGGVVDAYLKFGTIKNKPVESITSPPACAVTEPSK